MIRVLALDRGSLIGLDCPQRLGKLSQAEVTQGKLLKVQSRNSTSTVGSTCPKADYSSMWSDALCFAGTGSQPYPVQSGRFSGGQSGKLQCES